jgi:hypothetical protein
MKTIEARAPAPTMAGPILELDEAAAEKKGRNDKLEFKCGALASVNCNSQCLQDQQDVE